MIQLGEQREAGLRASDRQGKGRLMLLHPKLSPQPRLARLPSGQGGCQRSCVPLEEKTQIR